MHICIHVRETWPESGLLYLQLLASPDTRSLDTVELTELGDSRVMALGDFTQRLAILDGDRLAGVSFTAPAASFGSARVSAARLTTAASIS